MSQMVGTSVPNRKTDAVMRASNASALRTGARLCSVRRFLSGSTARHTPKRPDTRTPSSRRTRNQSVCPLFAFQTFFTQIICCSRKETTGPGLRGPTDHRHRFEFLAIFLCLILIADDITICCGFEEPPHVIEETTPIFQCCHKKLFCERHCRPKTQPTSKRAGTCICSCEDGLFLPCHIIRLTRCRIHGGSHSPMAGATGLRAQAEAK